MSEPLYKSRPGEPYPAKVGVQRVNDFIYLSEGLSNSFMIVGDEARVIINTGMNFEAKIHKHNFDSVCTLPTRYIILTQGHVDHVGGVDFLKEAGTQVVAQAGNPEHQAYDRRLAPFRASRSAFAFRDKNIRAFQQSVEQFGPPPDQAVPTPDILFEDRHELQLGSLKIELLGIPGGETNDSLVVWLPDHGICFPGNLFGCLFGHIPNLVTIRGDRYRDALTVAAAVERVMELEPEHLLVGHHAPIHGKDLIREELGRIRGATLSVHDQVVKGMNEGADVHTLMREVRVPPEFEVGEGYGTVRWSVRAIWEHYAGWFHHDSTTELYAVPQQSIHADLIELAGGTAPLVARAREHFDADEDMQALHLLDVVLSQPEPDAAAIDLSIAVHRKLHAQSVNFWLTEWLRNQIELIELRRKTV